MRIQGARQGFTEILDRLWRWSLHYYVQSGGSGTHRVSGDDSVAD